MERGRTGLGRVLWSVRRGTRRSRGTLRGVSALVSSKLHDLRVYRRDPVVAGHGDAVVAVAHEVRVADLL